jgi:hypothetical protein
MPSTAILGSLHLFQEDWTDRKREHKLDGVKRVKSKATDWEEISAKDITL